MRYSIACPLILLYSLSCAAESEPIKEFKILCKGSKAPNVERIDDIYKYSNGKFTYYMDNKTDGGGDAVYRFENPRVHYSEQHDGYGDFMMIHVKQKGLTGEHDPDMVTFEFKTKFEFDDGSEPWSVIYVSEDRARFDDQGYLTWVKSLSNERERCRLETLKKGKRGE